MGCSSASAFMRLVGTAIVLALVIDTAQAYALLGTVSGRNSCSSEQFECVTSNECIPKRWRCDGDRDCTDGSDEEPVACQNKTTNCPSKKFACQLHNDLTICAPNSWQCDGKEDCLGGSDEHNCENPTCTGAQFACKSGQCIQHNLTCNGDRDCRDGSDEEAAFCQYETTGCPSHLFACNPQNGHISCLLMKWRCDGDRDCPDGSDEENCERPTCSEAQFACKNGACIVRKWRCDADPDCSDGSDEEDCESVTCMEDEFACKSGQCIPHEHSCDGDRDCVDGSDEDVVICLNGTTTCPSKLFTCNPNNGNISCFHMRRRCDGEKDCPDGSDEDNCERPTCTEDEFTCKNGACIRRKWRCDADPDCNDGSDEEDCESVTCMEDQFACKTGQCIPREQSCDGNRDCTDGSDEDAFICLNGTTTCPLKLFTCNPQNGSISCLPMRWRCDGDKDCPDGSDEHNCSATPCTRDEFSCINGKCIPHHIKCDGQDDCGDGSDETGCQSEGNDDDNMIDMCTRGQFKCASNGQCILRSSVCDGDKNCPDGSDERDCDALRTKLISEWVKHATQNVEGAVEDGGQAL